MVTALCLNPSIDRETLVTGFEQGVTNRVLSVRTEGSGKGVNVAVAARRLGMKAACAGLLPSGGGPVLGRLAEEDVKACFVSAPGAIRVNTKVRDADRLIVTELNEPGAPADAFILAKTRARVLKLCARSDILVLTGSLPPGCPADYYADLISAAPPGCRCVLDASGDAFLAGLRARPFLVKPNLEELKKVFGGTVRGIEAAREAALWLIGEGAATAAVSMGADGALLTDGKRCVYAPALDVPVRSTVGAGDAMVAGMIAGITCGETLDGVLRRGAAAAAAAVAEQRGGSPRRSEYERYLPEVKILDIKH